MNPFGALSLVEFVWFSACNGNAPNSPADGGEGGGFGGGG